jgi:hypothetical protein
MVLRHGHVVAEGWWTPYAAGGLQLVYSLSKSFTATAAALAMGDGLLSLDEPVLSYFPELEGVVHHRRARAMLVRHLASMATGHLEDTWPLVEGAPGTGPVERFLQLPPEQEPGSVFAYNQSATYVLAAIVQRVTGTTLTGYLRPRLFGPLGMAEARWQQDASGRQLGFTGLYTTTSAVARLGLLYLQGGMWQGRQLLPPGWAAEASRPHVATSNRRRPLGPPEPDWDQGYGYQFWVGRHGYRGDGAFGQYCLVLPEQDVVIAITGQTPTMQRVLDMVWQHMLPAVSGPKALTGRGPAEQALAARLAALGLPAPAGLPEPPEGARGWAGTRFLPAGGRCEAQPSLGAVRLTAAGGAWQALIEEADWVLGVPFGPGSWSSARPRASTGEHVPVAAAGGWGPDGELYFEVVFLETPHRLCISCRLGTGTFDAVWVAAPLHGPDLSQLKAPTA